MSTRARVSAAQRGIFMDADPAITDVQLSLEKFQAELQQAILDDLIDHIDLDRIAELRQDLILALGTIVRAEQQVASLSQSN